MNRTDSEVPVALCSKWWARPPSWGPAEALPGIHTSGVRRCPVALSRTSVVWRPDPPCVRAPVRSDRTRRPQPPSPRYSVLL